jgi:hypothetical protein
MNVWLRTLKPPGLPPEAIALEVGVDVREVAAALLLCILANELRRKRLGETWLIWTLGPINARDTSRSSRTQGETKKSHCSEVCWNRVDVSRLFWRDGLLIS